jgi:hypothetical protein
MLCTIMQKSLVVFFMCSLGNQSFLKHFLFLFKVSFSIKSERFPPFFTFLKLFFQFKNLNYFSPKTAFFRPKSSTSRYYFFLLHEMFLEFNSTQLRHFKKIFFCPKTSNYFSPKTSFFLALRL